jgi:hypothetical protein
MSAVVNMKAEFLGGGVIYLAGWRLIDLFLKKDSGGKVEGKGSR